MCSGKRGYQPARKRPVAACAPCRTSRPFESVRIRNRTTISVEVEYFIARNRDDFAEFTFVGIDAGLKRASSYRSKRIRGAVLLQPDEVPTRLYNGFRRKRNLLVLISAARRGAAEFRSRCNLSIGVIQDNNNR